MNRQLTYAHCKLRLERLDHIEHLGVGTDAILTLPLLGQISVSGNRLETVVSGEGV
ncbi:hypothetical protein D3C84_978430 [compost metagenome]